MNRQIRIPYADPYFPEESVDILKKTFIGGQISGSGFAIDQMESQLKSLLNISDVIAVTNGSAAIRMAYQGLNLNMATRVVLPGWGFHVAANVAHSMGAQVEFRDVSDSSWCMEMSNLRDLADTTQHTIIVLVHTLGNCANLDEFEPLRNNPNISIIEDSAEAFMSSYGNRMLGTFFDVATFSMHAAKTITTGEGGFVAVTRADLSKKLRLLRNHGMSPDRPYLHLYPGDNYRLSNLLASLAIPQLNVINEIVDKRRNIYEEYKKRLQKLDCLSFMEETDPSGFFPWGVCVRIRTLDNNLVSKLREFLTSRDVDSRPGFTSARDLPYYPSGSSSTDELKVSNRLAIQTILLPQYFRMEERDLDFIAKNIEEFFSS